MSNQLGTSARPLRVAIIGSGPAGFYAAEALLKHKDLVCQIDFFNRLPTPYGLVREGVAPDHQNIKAITRVYDKVAEAPNVRYFGNVTFGRDILHEDVTQYYDQIVYAVGAQSDRKMGITGEDLDGSFPATIFVGWYNGHPDYRDLTFNLNHERVLVVGNGNVAMDVARILAADPDDLAKTDIADHALAALRQSKVREVVLLGRRGPAQAAFTNPELKEFGSLNGVDILIDPADLVLDPVSEASLNDDKTARKNVETLRSYAERGSTGASRRIVMRFLVSPVGVIGSGSRVAAVTIERNKLIQAPDGSLRAVGTGNYETHQCGMILRSVGYRGSPLPGVPFSDASGTIPNVAGRVFQNRDEVLPGEYVVGWAKRGPSGIIGTNKPDSVSTVAAMIEDVPDLEGIRDEYRDPQAIINLLRAREINYVTFEDWKILDAYEMAAGAAQGRPRVKVTRVAEMMEIIRAQRG
nr:FAD-dependent oxidoreductase [Oscillochloris trichoides]